ncbi:hypothetical protein, partial [Paracidovorax cattleyae]|uniref:hypothetical protein n=1 Tax=Paracidovorax cattleyae TaxID=80868 RepID=UPI001ABFDA95
TFPPTRANLPKEQGFRLAKPLTVQQSLCTSITCHAANFPWAQAVASGSRWMVERMRGEGTRGAKQ